MGMSPSFCKSGRRPMHFIVEAIKRFFIPDSCQQVYFSGRPKVRAVF